MVKMIPVQEKIAEVVKQMTGPPTLTRQQRQQVQVVVVHLELLLNAEEEHESWSEHSKISFPARL